MKILDKHTLNISSIRKQVHFWISLTNPKIFALWFGGTLVIHKFSSPFMEQFFPALWRSIWNAMLSLKCVNFSDTKQIKVTVRYVYQAVKTLRTNELFVCVPSCSLKRIFFWVCEYVQVDSQVHESYPSVSSPGWSKINLSSSW